MKRLAVASAVVAAFLTLAAGVLVALTYLDDSYQPEQSLPSTLSDVMMTLAFVVVGIVVTLKRPDNLVGWALSLAGVGSLFGGVLGAYGELALLAKPEAGLPGGAVAAAIDGGSWTPLMGGVFLLLLLFPRGRLPSPRWRPVVWFTLIGFAVIWVAITTVSGHLDPPFEAYENPLAVTSDAVYIVIFPIIGLCLVFVASAAISLLLRFRRSRGQERQQFKWLAASAGLLVLSLPVATAFNYSGAAGIPFGLALMALPISVGVAVLRYRLYDIDVIVRRTLVYGALTAGLGGFYLGIVLALQHVFSSVAGGSDLAIAGSTLAVAALFQPARSRVQAFVDRRFYRRKYDAERTLAAFASHLRDEVDLDALRAELAAVVAETMQPEHVTLWLKEAP